MTESRTFVIGDIHGCADEVCRLLDSLDPGPRDTICFLGDYIDRGPSSKEVVERMIRLQSEGPRCIFLKGNHEDMFLHYLGYAGNWGDSFLHNGGGTTLTSYGIEGLEGPVAASCMPESHIAFLLALRREAWLGSFLCVHAGLRPTLPLDEQSDEDAYWIREDFILHPHPFPCTILFGHTPQREVLLHLPFKIGLDTGCVYGNKLSCLELGSKELSQIRRDERDVVRTDLTRFFRQPSSSPTVSLR